MVTALALRLLLTSCQRLRGFSECHKMRRRTSVHKNLPRNCESCYTQFRRSSTFQVPMSDLSRQLFSPKTDLYKSHQLQGMKVGKSGNMQQ